jgi:hypothetical protein
MSSVKPKTITIKDYQKEYIDDHFINLSFLVQDSIDKIIQEEKNNIIELALDDTVSTSHQRRQSKGVKV